MIVKAYYDNGHFDVFDTLTLVDPSLFPRNALTNYSIELLNAGDRGGLWLNIYYYEAAGSYRGDGESPVGLPIARRIDGWSCILADSDDFDHLLRVTVDGEDALVRQGDEFADGLMLNCSADRAFVTNPKAVATHDYYAAALGGPDGQPGEEELCRITGHSETAYGLARLIQAKTSAREEDEDAEGLL
jgi:hypothetical protein